MTVIYQTDGNYPALTANTGCRAKRTKDGPREIRSRFVNAHLKMGHESEGWSRRSLLLLLTRIKKEMKPSCPSDSLHF